MSQPFDFERLVELCRRTHEETRHSAARAVDRSLVVRNWLFGWYVVEYEQSGADRAEYGAQTLKKLSAALKERIGAGFLRGCAREDAAILPDSRPHPLEWPGVRQFRDAVADFR